MDAIHKNSKILDGRKDDMNSYDSLESRSIFKKAKQLCTSTDVNTNKDLFENCESKEPAQEESVPSYYLRRSSRSSLNVNTRSEIEKHGVSRALQ